MTADHKVGHWACRCKKSTLSSGDSTAEAFGRRQEGMLGKLVRTEKVHAKVAEGAQLLFRDPLGSRSSAT